MNQSMVLLLLLSWDKAYDGEESENSTITRKGAESKL